MTETAIGALLIILAGAVARRAGVIRRDDGPVLVKVVIHLALPPLIFLILVRADLHGSLLLVPVAGFAIHGLLVGFVVVSTRLWGMDRPRAGALIVATAVGNTGFFGLPLIAASGDGFSLPAAVMYDALCTGVITWTSTVAIATSYGRPQGGPRVSLSDLGRSLLLPPTWALVAGLAVNLAGVEELPAIVERPFELLGAATLPLTMIYAGLMLDLRGVERLWRELGYAVVVRLGLSTLLGVAVAAVLRLEGDVRATVVIMAAMPTAMMSLVIGTRSGLRSDVLASAVVVTTLLSTLTLPALRAVLL
ncbi:AEC family transporter [Miltoncostaea oceani]|uniref:AEC family transporter n=1 Tax=Miltoncostaea oceani TaxID=2843216 RepID=UPI001C3D7D2A|nr:AEC family transporter [Miltoncostaea oceani]